MIFILLALNKSKDALLGYPQSWSVFLKTI